MLAVRGLLYFISFLFLLMVFFTLVRKRNQFAGLFFSMSVAIIVYACGYAFELGSTNVEEIKFWLKVEYFGLPFIPVIWYLFAYKSKNSRYPRFTSLGILFAVPLLTLFFAETNDYLHFLYRGISAVQVHGALLAQLDKGPWYYVHLVYSNLIVVASLGVFLQQWKATGYSVKSRSFTMILGVAFVLAAEFLYESGLSPHGIDLTPFGFMGAAFFQALAIVRYDFLKSDELVKNIVFSGISEGILVVDDQRRISDFNRTSQSLFPWLNFDCIGKKLAEFPASARLTEKPLSREPLAVEKGGKTLYYEIKRTELSDRGKKVGDVYIFKDVTAERRTMKRLYRYANYDTLTKVFNRRRLFEDGEKELLRAKRYGRQFSLLMLDLDHFKQVNDIYGHLVGDTVLEKTAGIIKRRLRSSDFVGRFGGEEFVVLLVEADKEKAAIVAEDIRACVEGLRVPCDVGEVSVTVSIGIASVDSSNPPLSFERLVALSDSALYRAKSTGRNRVCVA